MRYLCRWCGAFFLAVTTSLILGALGYLTVKDVRMLMGLCIIGVGIMALRQKATSAISFWGGFPLLIAFVLGYVHFSVRVLETPGWLNKWTLTLLYALTVFFVCGIGGHLVSMQERINKKENHGHLAE